MMKKRKYQSRYRQSQKKSVLRKRWFWDLVLVVLFLANVGYLMFFSPAFRLREIKVSAEEGIYPVKIFNLASANLNRNLFLVKTEALKDNILENFPEVRQVEIKKRFPHSLLLTVEKREASAVFCPQASSSRCSLIDETGAMFEEEAAENLNYIFSDRESIKQEEIAKILQIEQNLTKQLLAIEKFILEEERLNVEIDEGWQIYFDLSGDIGLALTKLTLLLEEEISAEQQKNLKYIDLRFSKAYYQ